MSIGTAAGQAFRLGTYIARHPRPMEAVRRRLLWYLARSSAHAVVIQTPNGLQAVYTRDGDIARDVILEGHYEDTERLAQVVSYLETRRSFRRGGTLLDIGANVGTTTMTALSSGAFDRVEAFEPERENLLLLNLTIAANRAEPCVTVHPCGVSDKDGAANLLVNQTNRGDHRIGAGDGVTVALRSIDSLVADGTIDISNVTLAWIDVQGHEASVLDGATTLMQHAVPVVMEFMPSALRESGQLDRLHEIIQGYARVVDLGNAVLTDVPPHHLVDIMLRLERPDGAPYTDLLLLPHSAVASQ